MIRVSTAMLNARKIAFRLFREEQKNSVTLRDLSAIQKGKVIKKMFKQLNKADTDALIKRAAVLDAKKAGYLDMSEAHRRKVSITPYELFYKEQSTNPSIMSIRTLGERERRLFAIYNSLPDRAKEALESRARQMSESGDLSTSSPPCSVPQKKHKKVSNTRLCSSNKKKSKPKTNKKLKSKKSRKGASPSPYAIFVKEHMPEVKHLPLLDRMKVIAEKWKASKSATPSTEGAQS